MLKTTIKSMPKLKKYGLTIEQIAEIFNYSSMGSFRNSSAYIRHLEAVEQIISIVEKEIIKRIGN